MELRDCQCFVAVAEELHFGRAAARLGMAQPPLSQRIRALEAELGAALFVRTSRMVALTPAGEAFWREARALLALAGEAAAVPRRVAAGLCGRLRVGFVNPAMDAFLSATLAIFRQNAPEVELVLREMGSREQGEALAAGRLDVGFLRLGGREPAESGSGSGVQVHHAVAGRGRGGRGAVAGLGTGVAAARGGVPGP